MANKILYIKNMVCKRCVSSVERILSQHNIPYQHVELGKAYLQTELSAEKKKAIAKDLFKEGFELLLDKDTKLIEEIKNLLVKLVHYDDVELKLNLSGYLSSRLSKDYASISHIFSKQTGYTIEKYYILQKIELAKELLVYDELNISEISYKLGYSSPAHFSAQFKKITGYSPSQFRKSEQQNRKFLDEI